jgi:putative ABC transport system permease protein
MFWNHLKTTLRNVKKQKSFAVINIVGLALGISAVLLILTWVRAELSYDRFHTAADRIFRITQRFEYDGDVLHQTQTPGILAKILREQCPEVEAVARVKDFTEGTLIRAGETTIFETRHGYADEGFFKVFSFQLRKGDPETALSSPNTAVISETAAKKYFGSQDPVGRILNVLEKDFRVTGVYEDMPDNSHFHLDVLCSVATVPRYNDPLWGLNAFKTYALLKKGASVEAFQEKIRSIIKRNMFHSEEEYNRITAKGNSTSMPLQKLMDIHLTSNLLWEFEPNGNGRYVRYLSLIAALILAIAVVNYVNLSTARSAGRAREVGVRKVHGSTRNSLIRRFIVESVLMTQIALILALGVVKIALPFFRNLVGKPNLQAPFFHQPILLLGLIVASVVVGIIGGLYPAMVLSSFHPIAVLRGKFSGGVKNSALRNALVVFQFSASVILIVGTIVVKKQMDYAQTKSLGYDREQVVVLNTYGVIGDRLMTVKDTLKRNPSVVSVSVSTSVPGKLFDNLGMRLEGTNSNKGTNILAVDDEYLETMRMEIAEGRFFSKAYATDKLAVVLNESKARALGVKDLLDKTMHIWVGSKRGVLPFRIIGIIKDFHYESFHEEVKPLAMIMTPGEAGWSEAYLSIRFRTGNVNATMKSLRQAWEGLYPGHPFEYAFMDSIYNELYENEIRTGRVFTLFTVFALFVACLGLFGLSSFTVVQRTKEIGIRKVLGAAPAGIFLSLSGDFSKWIGIANLLAWPLAYVLMKNWLRSFAYRIDLQWWMFGAAGILALLVSLLAVSGQTIKAARANPAESLKYE